MNTAAYDSDNVAVSRSEDWTTTVAEICSYVQLEFLETGHRDSWRSRQDGSNHTDTQGAVHASGRKVEMVAKRKPRSPDPLAFLKS